MDHCVWNKLMKIYNGNGPKIHSVSIVHWNLGATHWHRKLDHVEALILETEPDILFISEANLMASTPDYQRNINGYRLILPLTMDTMHYARHSTSCKDGHSSQDSSRIHDYRYCKYMDQIGTTGEEATCDRRSL